MASLLPGDLRTKMKEGLRDARFLAREMRASARKTQDSHALEGIDPAAGAAGLVTAIADFSDTALSALETIAIGLLSSNPKEHFGAASAYPLSRYFDGDAGAPAMFARDCYFAAKQILLAKGISNPRLSEELFTAAHRLAVKDLQHLLSGEPASDGSLNDIALRAAVLAKAILRARPVEAPRHIEDGVDGPLLDTGIFISAALSLATAVASYHHDVAAGDDIYTGVCAAVEARYSLFAKALASQERPEELAGVFADLMPHLP